MANDGQPFDWKKERKYLSKHKHIYQLYRSVDGTYHLEKYPVVYINKFYVYYHVNGSQTLDYISRSVVLNGIDGGMRENLKHIVLSGGCWRKFFWDADDSIIDFLNDCRVNRWHNSYICSECWKILQVIGEEKFIEMIKNGE